jgi:Fe-S cluster assembly protein SufD
MTDFFIAADVQKNYSFMFVEHKADVALHVRFYLERNAQVSVELLYSALSLDTFFEAKNTQDEREGQSLFAPSGVSHEAVIFIEAFLVGEGASISINGAYLLGGTHKLQLRTLQHHQAAHTKSNLIMRGVLNGNGHAVYNGMIRVDKAARASVSSQENKNILLSDAARALSVPSLEVLTNDVRCFHASAIGRFDQDQLFYAASRGITEKKAQRLLLDAFFGTLFKNEALKDCLGQLLQHE